MNRTELIKEIFDPSIISTPAICVEMSGNHQGSLESAIEFAEHQNYQVQIYLRSRFINQILLL